jgi:hypothetical protein
MRRPKLDPRKLGLAELVAAIAIALIVGGWFAFLSPHLRGGGPVVAGVPDPPGLFVAAEFTVPAHGQACLSAVTIDADSDLAQFSLWQAKPRASGGPPVDLLLSAPGYHAIVHVPGGWPGGSVTLPIKPPTHKSRLGTACFRDVGSVPVALTGTTETRTVSRSPMAIDGQGVYGDIALAFLDSRNRPLTDEIATTFDHASNLTDGLVPPALVWLIAIVVVLGVPLGCVAAFYLALREDEQAAGTPPSG